MMRWVFNIFALLSLLLCVATVVLWVRSYSWADYSVYSYKDGWEISWFAQSRTGALKFGEVHARWPLEPRGFKWMTLNVMDVEFEIHFPTVAGIGIDIDTDSSRGQYYWSIRVPHLWLAYIFAGLPILWCFSTYRRVRVKRRLRAGHCRECGYDLQGSGGKCPECGANRLQSH